MLNNTNIKRLKPRDKPYRILDYDGLYIEVRPNNRKIWRVRFNKPKPKIITLGDYPLISLDKARLERDALKNNTALGEHLFRDIALLWHGQKDYLSNKNSKVELRRLERYLIPSLGDRIISQIKSLHILPILKAIEGSGHLETAKRVRSIASQIFKYACWNLMCEEDPTAILVGATKSPKVTHFASITDEQGFSILLKKIAQANHFMPTLKYALLIAPFVFVRSSELRNAHPEEFDLDKKIWTIPAVRMKMKRDHIIPLHDSLIPIIEQCLSFASSEYLFAGQRKGRPISENTLNVALRSLGYDKTEVTFHGFRSSFSTLARESLRLDDDLIERQLAHSVGNSVKAAYDRSFKLEERAELMNEWGDYLLRLKKTTVD